MINRPSYKKIKKDYQRKNLQNPFFHKKVKAKNPNRFKWIVAAVFLVFIFLIWFIFAALLWKINKIEVTGLTRLGSAELEQKIWSEADNRRWIFFSESNLFLFKRAALRDNIISTYNFSGTEISKKWPNTLVLKVIERPYAFIFQEGSAYYYSSADAYIIKEPAVSPDDMKKYFILENKNSDSLITTSEKINIKDDYLNFIFSLNTRLSAFPELPIERFIIDHEFNTVKVKFVSGPVVFFSVKESADVQINRLILVKREKIKDNFSKTEYIDLRYGDKIFINPDFN